MEWLWPLFIIAFLAVYLFISKRNRKNHVKKYDAVATAPIADFPSYYVYRDKLEHLRNERTSLNIAVVKAETALIISVIAYIYWLICLPLHKYLDVSIGWCGGLTWFSSGVISLIGDGEDVLATPYKRYTLKQKIGGSLFYIFATITAIFILTILGFIWYFFCGGAFIGLFDDIFTNVAIGGLSLFLILYVAVGLLGLFR